VALLVRAITLRPDRLDAGLEDTLRVDSGDLTAWANEMDKSAPLGRDELLSHHRDVSAIFTRVESCLPARFPSWADSPQALQALLHSRRDDFMQHLQNLRHCCEIAITAVWLTPHGTSEAGENGPVTGRHYLLSRQRALQATDRRRERAKAIAGELRSLAREVADVVDVRQRLCPSPIVAFSLAFLVRREHAHNLAAALTRGAEDVRILVNGPWAPYSFTGPGPDFGDG
jgi:hypothetical protein